MKKILFLMLNLILVTFALQAAEVSGKVVDSELIGQADMNVTLSGWHQNNEIEMQATTDENGDFQFSDVLVGFYVVIADNGEDFPPFTHIQVETEDQVIDNVQIMLPGGTDPPSGNGSISGIVTDADGATIDDVQVTAVLLHSWDFEPVQAATNENGEFLLENLVLGEYRLMLVHDDYIPMHYPGWNSQETLELTEEQSQVSGINIEMESDGWNPPSQGEGVISGVVLDENNEVLRDVFVTAFIQGQHGHGHGHNQLFAQTNQNGEFEITGIPNGEYHLVAGLFGNQPTYYPELDEDGLVISDDVQEIENIVILMDIDNPQPPVNNGVVTGIVKDENGDVVVDAHVRIMGQGWSSCYSAFTEQDGTFRFENLWYGEYSVFATTGDWDDEILFSEEVELELTENNHVVEGIELILIQNEQNLPEGRIAGTLLNSNNEPIQRFISLIDVDNQTFYPTWSEPDGSFEFENVANGTYKLFTRLHWEDYFYMVDGVEAELVISDDIQEIDDIEFVVQNMFEEGNSTITLNIVQDLNGTATYHIHGDHNYASFEGEFTDQQVTINNVPAGEYFIQVQMDGYQNWFYDNTNNYDEIEMYELAEEDSAFINVDFDGFEIVSYTISGNIQNSEGNAIESAMISLHPEGCFGGGNQGNGWQNLTAITDSEGNYEVTIPAGEYSLMAHADGYVMQFWPGVVGFHNQETIMLTEDLDNMNFTLSTTYNNDFSISGNVTIEGNVPEDDQQVLIVAVSSEDDDVDVYTESTLCGDNGEYELVLDHVGEYYVLAITSGTIPEFYNDSYDWSEADLVNVTSGGVNNLDFDLVLPQSEGIETVSGTVTDHNGDTISGATVLMYNENNIPVAFATSNQNGQYSLAFLAAEDYTMKATKMYYQAYQTTVNPSEQDVVDPIINPTTTNNEIVEVPQVTTISNYPNPFNPTTKINFSIIEKSDVNVSIYNVKGQKVNTLVNDNMDAGNHSVIWNGKNFNNQGVSSGVYFMRLSTPKQVVSKKINLLK
jgi:hypothetical protein